MSDPAARARKAPGRIEAWNAAQWLARMTRSYAPGDTIALHWDCATRRLVTPEVAPGVRVGLALPTLVLQFEEQGRLSPHPLDVDDKSSPEIEAWLLIELLHRGFDREAFSKELPYTWPHVMSGDEAKYAPHEHAGELERLAAAFEAGAAVLADVSRAVGGSTAPTCSPERFDLGFDTKLPDGNTVRVGFTPGDGSDAQSRYVVGDPPIVEVPADAAPRDEIVARLTKPFAKTGR